MSFRRLLAPHAKKSFFLFGPRQTGKTTFVKELVGPGALYINLLPQQAHLAYAKDPGRFRAEVLSYLDRHNSQGTIVVDEVQKLPRLLDEVHDLIEDRRARFLLTGSSARKLKRADANLLAGRAYTYRMFPMTHTELGASFDLERALRIGTLPALWASDEEDPSEFLTAYADTYLKEEIAQEGIVRQLVPFSRFIDVVAESDGEIVNVSAIARECGVSDKSVREYFQILEDTFLAYRLPAWTRSVRRRLVTHAKYYLFDMGLTNVLAHAMGERLSSTVRGRRFEQLFVHELRALLSYARSDIELYYYRTHTNLEVDLILARGKTPIAAIEIKSTDRLEPRSLSGLSAFGEEFPKASRWIVGPFSRRRKLDYGVTAIAWDVFLDAELLELVKKHS